MFRFHDLSSLIVFWRQAVWFQAHPLLPLFDSWLCEVLFFLFAWDGMTVHRLHCIAVVLELPDDTLLSLSYWTCAHAYHWSSMEVWYLTDSLSTALKQWLLKKVQLCGATTYLEQSQFHRAWATRLNDLGLFTLSVACVCHRHVPLQTCSFFMIEFHWLYFGAKLFGFGNGIVIPHRLCQHSSETMIGQEGEIV